MDAVKAWISANKRTVATVAALLIVLVSARAYQASVSRLDDDLVGAYYQDHINALRRFDADTLCNMMANEYRSTETVVTDKGAQTYAIDKRRACEEARASMRMMWEISKATGAEPELKYTIGEVTFSEDRRSADVQVRGAMKIGGKLSIEFTATERLVRRLGEVRSLGGKSRSTMSIRR